MTKNPPKILTDAKIIAKNHKYLMMKNYSITSDKAAIIAPTMITEEIAFVTDINGVCNDGVTLIRHSNQQILII